MWDRAKRKKKKTAQTKHCSIARIQFSVRSTEYPYSVLCNCVVRFVVCTPPQAISSSEQGLHAELEPAFLADADRGAEVVVLLNMTNFLPLMYLSFPG